MWEIRPEIRLKMLQFQHPGVIFYVSLVDVRLMPMDSLSDPIWDNADYGFDRTLSDPGSRQIRAHVYVREDEYV